MTHRLMAVVAVLGLASGCLVTTDGDGGEGGLGGNTTNGGSPTTGGNTTDGGGGSTSNANGGAGGATACTTSEECPAATAVCTEALCDEGLCSIIESAASTLCDKDNGEPGFCNGDPAAPACVDCVLDGDCSGNQTCDDNGTCVSGPWCVENADCETPDTIGEWECVDGACYGPPCGNNLCQLQQGNDDCIACVIMECNAENIACGQDQDGNQCTSCSEWLVSGNTNFCPGSEAKAQAIIECACAVNVCSL